MAQLGYTWYPQDWWTSETFKRLKRYPLVRYALRELFDLMYKEGQPIEMTREYLYDDFNIVLSDNEFNKLMEYIDLDENGNWWISSIRKRISKAEAARENGKKGGAPKGNKNAKKQLEKTTQQPRDTTQANNPKNPPSEREREKKEKYKLKEKENITRAIDFLKIEKEIEFSDFEMQNKKLVNDWNDLIENFNDKIDIEISQGKIEWEPDQLMPRLRTYTRSWIANQSKDSNNNKTNNKTNRPTYF